MSINLSKLIQRLDARHCHEPDDMTLSIISSIKIICDNNNNKYILQILRPFYEPQIKSGDTYIVIKMNFMSIWKIYSCQLADYFYALITTSSGLLVSIRPICHVVSKETIPTKDGIGEI